MHSESGYYAIFTDNAGEFPNPFRKILQERDTDLIYVGIAEKTHLIDRLVHQDLHHHGPSTFFRSLGSVLGFTPPRGSLLNKKHRNYKFAEEDTQRIVDWINQHIIVRWIAENSALLANEKSIIRQLRPLLNLKHNPARVPELSELRRRCLARAKERPLAI